MRHEHAGIAGPGGLIWLQLVIVGVVIGVPVLAAGGAMMFRLRSARMAARSPAPGAGQRERYFSQVRRCSRAGLLVGALAGLACVAAGRPVLAVFCCALGYLLGLLTGEVAAAAPDRDAVRTASLTVRRPAGYAPRWARYAALFSGVVMIAAPVVFSVTPGIRYRSSQPVPGVMLPGGTTSWPSLVTSAGGAALAATVLVLGGLTLRRVATRAVAAELEDPGADELLRRQAGRAVAGAVLATELLLLGAMLIAGSEGLAVPATASAAYLASRALIWAGLACIAGGIGSWLALSGRVRKSRIAVLLAAAPASRAAG
jgi:hypothetical protein